MAKIAIIVLTTDNTYLIALFREIRIIGGIRKIREIGIIRNIRQPRAKPSDSSDSSDDSDSSDPSDPSPAFFLAIFVAKRYLGAYLYRNGFTTAHIHVYGHAPAIARYRPTAPRQ